MDDDSLFSDNYRLSKVKVKHLKGDEFDEFIFKVHIYGKSEVLEELLTAKRKKNRYIRLLDHCLARAIKYKETIFNAEEEFLDAVTLEALPDLIENEAKKFGVEIHRGFRMYYVKVIDELEDLYENADRQVFEEAVVKALQGGNGVFKYKLDLINILLDDQKYAYCWMKYIKLARKRIPKSLRKLDKMYKADAEAFIKRMNGEESVPSLTQINNEVCQAFGKTYKLITVTTPTELQSFIHTYFIQSKPDILGIDAESIPIINQVALIQLATKDWCCIIDVHQLAKELPALKWKSFFEDHIFNPAITRIGFALASDYYFIGNTFPYLSTLMQRESSKSLCIKKLVESILKNPQAHRAVFPGQIPTTVSLANVAETILGVKLDKDMQRSDWTQRPLTGEQKAYAIIDAVVVLLIKEKIEDVLKQKLGPTVASKIIEEAKVSMKREKGDVDKLTRTLAGATI